MEQTAGCSNFGNHSFRICFETSGRGSFEIRQAPHGLVYLERHEPGEFLTTTRMVLKGESFQGETRRYVEVR